jgi:hypothetical protein
MEVCFAVARSSFNPHPSRRFFRTQLIGAATKARNGVDQSSLVAYNPESVRPVCGSLKRIQLYFAA